MKKKTTTANKTTNLTHKEKYIKISAKINVYECWRWWWCQMLAHGYNVTTIQPWKSYAAMSTNETKFAANARRNSEAKKWRKSLFSTLPSCWNAQRPLKKKLNNHTEWHNIYKKRERAIARSCSTRIFDALLGVQKTRSIYQRQCGDCFVFFSHEAHKFCILFMSTLRTYSYIGKTATKQQATEIWQAVFFYSRRQAFVFATNQRQILMPTRRQLVQIEKFCFFRSFVRWLLWVGIFELP